MHGRGLLRPHPEPRGALRRRHRLPVVDTPTADCDPCEPNDTAAGAIDVTAGGMFSANALAATDDLGPDGCGNDGGRDLFYRVDLASPRVFYFDTFDLR